MNTYKKFKNLEEYSHECSKLMNNLLVNTIFKDLLSALRIRQWSKNVLLLTAPIGAAVQPTANNLKFLTQGILAFCFISSAGYILNDWVDKEQDKYHAKKRFRPFAAQRLNLYHAIFLVLLLVTCSVLVSATLPRLFSIWLLTYALSTTSYSLKLKKIPVVELVAVAFGFLVRCLAGAAIFEVKVSQWFLIVTGFGSLFLIGTKRIAEFKNNSKNDTRPVILQYSESFLNSIICISISVTIMAYALWAFEVFETSILGKLSVLPILIGVLRYLWHSETEDGETPEKAIFSDKLIPFCGAVSAVMLILAIYL
jgi:decaprenyl-phosphate phosphoribosyltransferase